MPESEPSRSREVNAAICAAEGHPFARNVQIGSTVVGTCVCGERAMHKDGNPSAWMGGKD